MVQMSRGEKQFCQFGWGRRLLAGLTSLFFALGFVVSPLEAAAYQDLEDDPSYVAQLSEEEVAEGAPMVGRAVVFSLEEQTISPYTGKTYLHEEQVAGQEISYGIDVSKWNGMVDWNKVYAAGIRFVILRSSYTGRSKDHFSLNVDEYFLRNIVAARAVGLKVGIYHFSQATSKEEAVQEANFVLELLKPYRETVTLPVFLDMETNGEDRVAELSKKQNTDNALAFFDTIEAAGYQTGYYGSALGVPERYDVSRLGGYLYWIARYNNRTKMSCDYCMWQYTDKGKVDGISTNVDCIFGYDMSRFDVQEPDTEEPDGELGGIVTVPNPGTPELPEFPYAAVVAVSAHVREEPDVESAEVAMLRAGTEVFVLDQIGAWSSIYWEDEEGDHNGYVGTEFLEEQTSNSNGNGVTPEFPDTPENPDVPEDPDTPENPDVPDVPELPAEEYYAEATGAVNLRAGAGTAYTVLTVVTKGAQVKVLEEYNSYWSRVSYQDAKGKLWTGFVSAGYLKKVEKPTDKPEVKPDPTPEVNYAKTTGDLNLRKGPSTSYAAITVLSKGAVVKVLSTEDQTWWKVSITTGSSTTTGYASSRYLEALPDALFEVKEAKTTGSVNLRSGAGTNYQVVAVLPANRIVKVVDNTNVSWWKVETTVSGNAKTGFVSAKYLSTDLTGGSVETVKPEEKPENNPAQTVTRAKTTGSVYLRQGKGSSTKALATLGAGTEVEVLDPSDAKWWQVKADTRYGVQTGYISSKYLTAVSGQAGESQLPESKPEEKPESKPVETSTSYSAVRTTEKMFMRKGKSSGTGIQATIAAGRTLLLLDGSGDWWKVAYNHEGDQHVGYIHKSGLEKITPKLATTNGTVNFRKGPSSSSTILAKDVPAGKQVMVLDNTGSWWKVAYGQQVGYMHVSYLK